MLMLLVACLAADPMEMPSNIREYFERQESYHQMNVSTIEQSIKDLQIKIKGEPLAKRKAVLTAQLHKAEDAVVKLRKAKERGDLVIKARPEEGQIGTLPPSLKVHAVIDDDTAILSDGVGTVIVKVPTKAVKARTPFRSQELWEVTAVGTGDAEFRRYLPDAVGVFGCYTARPLKAADLKRYRGEFEAEQKLKKSE
ncbi:MAG: hypothetical protein JWP89_7084 [Schlesneria sp.]|nr:hypothetical protein [Schlesneria sp.]